MSLHACMHAYLSDTCPQLPIPQVQYRGAREKEASQGGICTFEGCSSSCSASSCSRLKLSRDSTASRFGHRHRSDGLNFVQQGVPNDRQGHCTVGHPCCRGGLHKRHA